MKGYIDFLISPFRLSSSSQILNRLVKQNLYFVCYLCSFLCNKQETNWLIKQSKFN